VSGEKVWVTGLGCFCSIGTNTDFFWHNLLAGDCGIKPLTRFQHEDIRSPLAGEAVDPEGEHFNRADRMACGTASEALKQAGMDVLPEGAGIAVGASVGGLPESEDAYRAFLKDGKLNGKLRAFLGHVPASIADTLGNEFGATGPRTTVVNACASGTTAIGLASEWIASGETDCVLAGGCDALARLTVGGFNILRLVSESPPKPFDGNRSGMVVGEGSAFLVLESEKGLQKRNHIPLATIDGWGFSSDGYHITAPHPEGEGAFRAISDACRMAGYGAERIDHVNAHGTGTKANDGCEAIALQRFLGDRVRDVPVTSIKGAVGHTLGAAGAIEAVASVMAIIDQKVPPNTGLESIDDAVTLLLPGSAEERPINSVLSLNLAFGGNNAAVIFGRPS